MAAWIRRFHIAPRKLGPQWLLLPAVAASLAMLCLAGLIAESTLRQLP
jgi:hypothetical protein